jgi:hypothetical protein
MHDITVSNYEQVDDEQSTYTALKRPGPGAVNEDHLCGHLNQMLQNVTRCNFSCNLQCNSTLERC